MDFRFEFVEALKENHAYDFIAEHYWEMGKDTLKDICLECIYALENPFGLTNSEIESVKIDLINGLNDLWEEYYDCE